MGKCAVCGVELLAVWGTSVCAGCVKAMPKGRWWTELSYKAARERFARHGWLEVGWRSMGGTLYQRPSGGPMFWVLWGGIVELDTWPLGEGSRGTLLGMPIEDVVV